MNSPADTERTDPVDWVDLYGDYLYRYAVSRLRDSNVAEDVVQETFIAGIRHHDQFSGKGSQRGWLLGILKRKIIDYVRKRNRQERVGSFEDETDPTVLLFDANGQWKKNALPDTSPDRNIQSLELNEIVQDCLTHLPQGQADVFILSVMEELESEQICQELDITPQNLWVRLHRARLGLAKCVSSKWYQEEVPHNVK
jgi:RNA polymerase sigma-70 factor (ECF subfamily)